MAKVIAQVTLNRDSGLPEDVITNTYHFESDDNVGTDAASGTIATDGPGLLNRLESFYMALGPLLAGSLKGTGIIKLYDWADLKPRIVRLERTFTHTTGVGSLPGEVALVLSMKAKPAAGQAAARRRGRVYLGPLNTSVSQAPSATSADPRPDTNDQATMLNAARTMARGSAGGSFRLAVFSPTTFAITADADASWNDVETLWMDNAFDTVRSRGARATSRSQVTLGTADAPVVLAG
jgi:hypothetical protein